MENTIVCAQAGASGQGCVDVTTQHTRIHGSEIINQPLVLSKSLFLLRQHSALPSSSDKKTTTCKSCRDDVQARSVRRCAGFWCSGMQASLVQSTSEPPPTSRRIASMSIDITGRSATACRTREQVGDDLFQRRALRKLNREGYECQTAAFKATGLPPLCRALLPCSASGQLARAKR